MNSQNYENIEKEVLEKHKKKSKAKQKNMKVSGAGVKKLQEIISGNKKNKKINILFFLFFFLFLFIMPALASEQVDDFTVKINLQKDGSLNIEESIFYNFDDLQKHGIYRIIPCKYKARGGNYNLRLSDINVRDEKGNSYNFFISQKNGKKKIKIGDADKLVSGRKKYIITYKVNRAINYFENHDELYWNVVGDEWEVPIMQSKATVFFEHALPSSEIKDECFSGRLGSQNSCNSSRYNYQGDSVKSVVFIDDKLNPGNFFTIVVGTPKGFIEKSGIIKNAYFILADNLIILLPLAVLIFFFLWWFLKGKDPEGRKTIIAQFESPDALTPSEVGTLIDEKVNKKDISAEIINLAIKGYLKIVRINSKKLFFKKDDYILQKQTKQEKLKNKHEQQLLDLLFKSKNKIKNKDAQKLKEEKIIEDNIPLENLIRLSDLKDKFYKDLEIVRGKVYKSLVSKGYFPKNPKKVRGMYMGFGFVFILLGFFSGSFLGTIGFLSFLVSALIIIFFSFIMPQKTRKGVLAREHILGLKKYLEVAEKDRINFHNAPSNWAGRPSKDPKHFEKLLPFAMVLGVEKKWAKQFEDIYDGNSDWYSDQNAGHFSALNMANSLNNFSTKTNSVLASSPSGKGASGGGSGFSGGGFSGGGFGGGGGGSW